MYTRKQYLRGEVSHETYYRQFVTERIIRYVVITIGEKDLLWEFGRHPDNAFNGIPLKRWDAMAPAILQMVDRKLIKEAGDTCWRSLGFAVCVAKQAAQMYCERQKKIDNE